MVQGDNSKCADAIDAQRLSNATLKYPEFRELCKRTGIKPGSLIKISFTYRGQVIARFSRVEPPPRKILVVKPPKGEEVLDYPIQQNLEYWIPLGPIRAIEKLGTYPLKRGTKT